MYIQIKHKKNKQKTKNLINGSFFIPGPKPVTVSQDCYVIHQSSYRNPDLNPFYEKLFQGHGNLSNVCTYSSLLAKILVNQKASIYLMVGKATVADKASH